MTYSINLYIKKSIEIKEFLSAEEANLLDFKLVNEHEKRESRH